MTAHDGKFVDLDWARSRAIVSNVFIDFFDQPQQGVIVLSHPTEQFAYKAIAKRDNPNGLDLYLMGAWSVPSGTAEALAGRDRLVSDRVVQSADYNTVAIDFMRQVCREPSVIDLLLVMSSGRRLLGAFRPIAPLAGRAVAGCDLLRGISFEP